MTNKTKCKECGGIKICNCLEFETLRGADSPEELPVDQD